MMKAPSGRLFRNIGVVLAAISVLTLATPAVTEQGAGIEWEILIEEVKRLYRAGKYDRAVIVAKKALEVAEKTVGPDHPDVATSLLGLGTLYDEQGKYEEAEPLYKRALAILEAALGPDHPSVATSFGGALSSCRTKQQGRKARTTRGPYPGYLAIINPWRLNPRTSRPHLPCLTRR